MGAESTHKNKDDYNKYICRVLGINEIKFVIGSNSR
jgi:hypothetical protein